MTDTGTDPIADADLIVIGGGISGLAAAARFAERHPDARVVLLEATDRVGGKLRLEEVAGHAVDVGAESMLTVRPEAVELARRSGVSARLIEPASMAATVRAGGTDHPLPTRTLLGIPGDVDAVAASGLLDEATLGRIRSELADTSRRPLDGDVTVGSLVRERLGDAVVDRLVDPLLGGVYAGHADRLSLQATMPALYTVLADEGGSLVQAVARVTGARSAPAQPSAAVSPGGSRASTSAFASLSGGLGGLPAAVVASGGFEVRTSTTVTSLSRSAEPAAPFTVRWRSGEQASTMSARHVIVATPPGKAAALLSELAPVATKQLRTVATASVAVLTFAFRRGDIAAAGFPLGSGQLVAGTEGLMTKAMTYSSQKWAADTGELFFMRASVGRVDDVAALQLADEELLAAVRQDIARLTGLSAVPVDSVVTRWGGGLPQYAPGHVDLVARVRAGVEAVPGLAVCGATYDGVGIPACIGSAWQAVDMLESVPAGGRQP